MNSPRQNFLLTSAFQASLFLGALACKAQSFTQTLGGLGAQDGVGAWAMPTGYQVAVRDHSSVHEGYNAKLLTTNATGGAVGLVDLALPVNSFLQQVVNAPDGSAFVVGSSLHDAPRGHDALILRMNTAGEVLWMLQPELPGPQQLFGGTALADGGAVLCGLDAQNGGHRPFVLRCSASGEITWTYFGPNGPDAEAYAVAVEGDAILVTGRQRTFSGHDDILLIRLDLAGNPIWNSSLGGNAQDVGRAVVSLGSGEFLIAGWTNSFGTFDISSQRRPYHAYLLAIDLDGDTLWTRTLGDTTYDQRAYAMQRLPSGDLYLAGERGTSALSNAMVMRTSSTGSIQWQRALDLGKEERLTHILPLSDGLLTTGWSFGEFGRQTLLVKRNAEGN